MGSASDHIRRSSNAATCLTFSMTYSTAYGERVYVVGSPPELGGWSLPSAVPMKWHPQHIWAVTVPFTPPSPNATTRFEYKFFVAPADAPSAHPLWEPGQNHVLDIAPGTPVATLPHRWGDGIAHDILPSHVPPHHTTNANTITITSHTNNNANNANKTNSTATTTATTASSASSSSRLLSAPTTSKTSEEHPFPAQPNPTMPAPGAAFYRTPNTMVKPSTGAAVTTTTTTTANTSSALTPPTSSLCNDDAYIPPLAASASPPPTPAYRPSPGAPGDPVTLAAARLASNARDELVKAVFRVRVPRTVAAHPQHAVYVVGSVPALGAWDKAHSPRMRLVPSGQLSKRTVPAAHNDDTASSGFSSDPLNDSFLPAEDTPHDHELWELAIPLPRELTPQELEYKYLVRQLSDGKRCWEPGPNRRAVCENDTMLFHLDDCWDRLRCVFSIFYPTPLGGIMHITGDPVEIGGWFRPGPKPMRLGPVEKIETEVEGRKWRLAVWFPRDLTSFSYRYAVIYSDGTPALWEREPNRRADFASYDAAVDRAKAAKDAHVAGSSAARWPLCNGQSDRSKMVIGTDTVDRKTSQNEINMPDNSVRFFKDVNFVANMQFEFVPPDTFIGPYPQNEADVNCLADAGATAVLNVQTDEDFAHRGINWGVLAAQYAKRNVTVVRFPIQDFNPQSLGERLHGAAHALYELTRQGHKVYVHCTAGMGRAPAVVVAHLCWVHKYSLDGAVAHVKKHRPVAVPNVNVLRRCLERPF